MPKDRRRKARKERKSFRKAIVITTLLALVVAGGLIAGHYLQLPKQDSSGGLVAEEPTLGSPDAPMTIIEFADFQCPFCAAVAGENQRAIEYLRSKDPDWEPIVPNLRPYIESGQVKLVFRNFPFLGPESQWAAEAAECAHEQGRFWEYYDKLWANQKGENTGAFSKENLKRFAAELVLETKAFNRCLDSGKYAEEVQDDKEEGQRLGVRGTPAFFIDGQLVSGAQPFSAVQQIIERKLAGE